jgi:hypothetical protein
MPVVHQITHRVSGEWELFQIVRTYSPELNRIAAPVAQLSVFHVELTVTVDNPRGGIPFICGMTWTGGKKK